MQPSKRLGAFWALNLALLPNVLASETCPQLSGSVYTGPNNNKFDILCDTSTVNGQIFAYYSNGDLFQDCVDRCDSNSNCVVALYLSGSGDCALINTYQGTRSFVGNDVAIKGAAETTTAASTEATSTEATTSEAATSSEAATTSEAVTTDATSTEATSTEATTSEATSTEAIASTGTTASTEVTTSEAVTTEIATTSETSSLSSGSLSSTSETLTSAQSTTATIAVTDSLSTTTASAETSTDDCDDETSTRETSTTVPTSTLTGSEVQPTTSSTDSQSSSSTTDQISEVSTSAPSATSTISSPSSSVTTDSQASLSTSVPTSVTSQAGSSLPVSSGTTVTQIYTQTYATYSQVASSSGSSSSGTTKVGSKTLSTSGVTTIKTTSGSHLPTPYPTTYNVWTVCLTVVEHVTCSTGVVTETATTTTYVTVGSNGGNYGPPVITTPAGCIGGYQVDASGHSYPVAQPTKGSHVNSPGGEYSQPSVRPTSGSPANSQSGYETAKVQIPTPAAKPHGNSQPGQGDKEPSVPGQGSSEPNNSKPQPTQDDATQTAISEYHPGVPVNPSPSSAIHQGQQGISTIFTTKASVTEEMQAPKSTHSGSSEAGEAPYTPVTISGANRFQYMIWTLAAGALLGFGMLL
ncbi:hypothetical protein H9Q72_007946 [Fusarium xylarioides]|uniref:Proteoglycan n=1 Tax=Fusarium xylarioides TaxID=221167 RepID=A0A9P7HQF7_9HYPO|nr:hypothetical protein H9Q72_007946 [Fusarium xylarioides]